MDRNERSVHSSLPARLIAGGTQSIFGGRESADGTKLKTWPVAWSVSSVHPIGKSHAIRRLGAGHQNQQEASQSNAW